ncbi:protein phosphatase inhibitor 2-like isoform X3 [Narcine bancroftii]|uniref:protein phosphatase inhibitor 2-like isoform X3 n=1 Tax=Narcine bancroftii TaxID=1343680 RepID=UPI003831D297
MDKPVKGILKRDESSKVVKDKKPSEEGRKSQTWDEMNIIATYKPLGKEYGLMSIDEAKTPYRYDEEDKAGTSSSGPSFTVEELRARMGALTSVKRGERGKSMSIKVENNKEGLSLFDKERKREFELRRKQIYDEGQNIKHARELIAREGLDESDSSDSVFVDDYNNREFDDHQANPDKSACAIINVQKGSGGGVEQGNQQQRIHGISYNIQRKQGHTHNQWTVRLV